MFKPVPPKPDFPAQERATLAWWKETRAFEKLRQLRRGGPTYSFMDGPITANNPMGVHHAWGRSYKDMFQRYHAMSGRRLSRSLGTPLAMFGHCNCSNDCCGADSACTGWQNRWQRGTAMG